jgi:hypothetical protein
VLAQFQNARGEGIAPAEIVEEPAIELRGLERLLDIGDAFGRCGIGAHGASKDGAKEKDRQREAFHEIEDINSNAGRCSMRRFVTDCSAEGAHSFEAWGSAPGISSAKGGSAESAIQCVLDDAKFETRLQHRAD